MARKRLTLEQVDAELRRIAAESEKLLQTLESDAAARKAQQGGLIIQARSQEILTEKGHIDTGALRRSANTRTVREALGLSTEVGYFMFYAPFVEALPDGGFLLPASEEKFEEVSQFIAEQLVQPTLRRWGEQRP